MGLEEKRFVVFSQTEGIFIWIKKLKIFSFISIGKLWPSLPMLDLVINQHQLLREVLQWHILVTAL